MINHKIVLTQENTLSLSPLFCMSMAELRAVKQYLLDNLSKGFISPSQALYASPVLFVRKADGSLRFCIDFQKLNVITCRDQYPLPLIDETLARLSHAKIFTKLDICQAFHWIHINPASEDLTTFRTCYRSYKCKVLPFGLTNAPATFQAYMDRALGPYLDCFVICFLDDVLVYLKNHSEHEAHVKTVLQKFKEFELYCKVSKCEFSVPRVNFLGFIVSESSIEMETGKIQSIEEWPTPESIREVQILLRFTNFYRYFVKSYLYIILFLINLLWKSR